MFRWRPGVASRAMALYTGSLRPPCWWLGLFPYNSRLDDMSPPRYDIPTYIPSSVPGSAGRTSPKFPDHRAARCLQIRRARHLAEYDSDCSPLPLWRLPVVRHWVARQVRDLRPALQYISPLVLSAPASTSPTIIGAVTVVVNIIGPHVPCDRCGHEATSVGCKGTRLSGDYTPQ
eukprot:1303662-Pyramimonas_sp.AAC.1